jgi:hypothetical protein
MLVTLVTVGMLVSLVTTVTRKVDGNFDNKVTTETIGTSVANVTMVISVAKLVLNADPSGRTV